MSRAETFPLVYRPPEGRKATGLTFLVFALLLGGGFAALLVMGLSVLVYEVTGRGAAAGVAAGILVALVCLALLTLFAASVTRGAVSEVRILRDTFEHVVWGRRRRLPFSRLAAVQLYFGTGGNDSVLTLKATVAGPW